MAKLLVYTVYDSKVEAFMQPFFCRTKGEALRIWQSTVKDPSTQFNKHPGDFTLFETAEFDEETGSFIQRQALENMGTALQAKNEE